MKLWLMNLKMNLIYIDFIHCTTIFIRSYTLLPIVLCLGTINKRIFLQLLLGLVQIVDGSWIYWGDIFEVFPNPPIQFSWSLIECLVEQLCIKICNIEFCWAWAGQWVTLGTSQSELLMCWPTPTRHPHQSHTLTECVIRDYPCVCVHCWWLSGRQIKSGRNNFNFLNGLFERIKRYFPFDVFLFNFNDPKWFNSRQRQIIVWQMIV